MTSVPAAHDRDVSVTGYRRPVGSSPFHLHCRAPCLACNSRAIRLLLHPRSPHLSHSPRHRKSSVAPTLGSPWSNGYDCGRRMCPEGCGACLSRVLATISGRVPRFMSKSKGVSTRAPEPPFYITNRLPHCAAILFLNCLCR